MKKLFFVYFLLAANTLCAQRLFNVSSMALAGPYLAVSPTSLTLTSTAGAQGSSQSATVTGSSLGSNNVTIGAVTGYVISLDNSTWSTSQTITPSSGSVNQVVYFALSSSNSAGTVNGTSTISCSGANSVTVSLNGTVSTGTTLSASPTTLTLTSTAGVQGSSQSTTVTGAGLGANNVTVGAATGYVISLNNSSFSTSQTITPSGGSVSQTVYYALASSNSAGTVNHTSSISDAGAGVSSVTITLNGTVSGATTPDSVKFEFDSTLDVAGFVQVTGDPSESVKSGTVSGTTISWTTDTTSNWGTFYGHSAYPNNGTNFATIPTGAGLVMREAYFNGNVYNTSHPQFTVTGLLASTAYVVTMYGSVNDSSGATNALTQMSVMGASLQTSQTFQAAGNINAYTGQATANGLSYAYFSSVTTDSTGKLTFYVGMNGSGQQLSALSAITIVKVGG